MVASTDFPKADTQKSSTSRPATTRSRVRHLDRIALTKTACERIDSWIQQVISKRRGVDLTRKDVVNWIIESRAAELPTSDEKALADRFYDEVRFLKQALKELRTARARGDQTTLEDILAGKRETKSDKRPRRSAGINNKPPSAAVAAVSDDSSVELPLGENAKTQESPHELLQEFTANRSSPKPSSEISTEGT